MLSTELMIYSLVSGGVYLLLVSILLNFIGKIFKIEQGIPESMIEKTNTAWFFMIFVAEFLFFVTIPTVGYSFIYLVLPFEGVRPAMTAALFAFALGTAPMVMGISLKLRLPMSYLVFLLFSYFVKLMGCFIIIGYLYHL